MLDKLKKHFVGLEDPRIASAKIKHNFWGIIGLCICGTICVSDGFKDIEEYGKAKEEWLSKFLPLENGIPSHDTIARVISMICPKKFHECFQSWVNSFVKVADSLIAIDGKKLLSSCDKKQYKNPLYLVHAWATEHDVLLGQVKTEAKSNEVTAIPKLLDLLEVEGNTISIDAMGCQKKIADKIDKLGGNYNLAVKNNHPNLFKSIEEKFSQINDNDSIKSFLPKKEINHGREEVRKFYLTDDLTNIYGANDWSGLSNIGMVESFRTIDGKTSTSKRYYIISGEITVGKFARNTRDHWRVENNLHWVLDVNYREDENRVRKDNASENLALLRRLTLNMIKLNTSCKIGVMAKRKKAGWDNQYLLKILGVSN